MNKFVNSIYKNQALIYKVILYLATTALIVYMYPKGSQFKYELTKGKPWQYDTYYAPFDFGIQKTKDELNREKQDIEDNHSPYFDYDQEIADFAISDLEDNLDKTFNDSIMEAVGIELVKFSKRVIHEIYNKGVIKPSTYYNDSRIIFLKKENEATEVVYKSLLKEEDLDDYLDNQIELSGLDEYTSELREVFFESVKPNVFLNKELTEKDLESRLNELSETKGIVSQGTRIISKGEVIDSNKLQILESVKKEYESSVWNASNYYVIVGGYALLVALALLMLLLFMRKHSREVFINNKEVTFVFFNVILVVAMTLTIIKFEPGYVYAIPIGILPITLKVFFETRLALFTHVITILILGFVVPNSYEYMFLQVMVGIVIILGFSELYKRANLFISVGQITLTYMFAYFAFSIIQEGDFMSINFFVLLLFIINGILTLFVQPLIYAYEKSFGLVSDMSLLELSNTNSKLLKELSNKAPGTFHHSLNVANLAEAAANEINANAMLVRVGALHHDIGKMPKPTYFTENQTTSVNPHDELNPYESAEVIKNHVIHGIEMAKNYQLPDRIIDFIRTHHGTTTIYYFYKLAQEEAEKRGEKIDIKDFQYPGPKPFSKETAILMMSDSVEAASKSLKEPTSQKIDDFVEKIIDNQMKQGQFLNADITFKEIQIIKKVLKRKLNSIYHLRVEYPE